LFVKADEVRVTWSVVKHMFLPCHSVLGWPLLLDFFALLPVLIVWTFSRFSLRTVYLLRWFLSVLQAGCRRGD